MSSNSNKGYQYEHFAVTVDSESYIAHVELNRPDKLNAINELFTSDLQGLSTGTSSSHNAEQTSDAARKATGLMRHVKSLQGSVIAVLHGYSFGGAIDISCACDIRLCTSDVKFSVKETAIGLAADVGTLSRLPKLGISMSWVKEVCYTSRVFGAEEAESVGFIGGGGGSDSNGVFRDKNEAMEGAMKIASAIAGNSPVAVQGTKRLIDWSRDHSVDDGLALTAVWNSAMVQTDDIGKAAMANLKDAAGKRQAPKFSKL
ncbi:MAG: hypothetical protein M1831_005637 [Alyxoria varia]|nr:MAG: hypothetical protein M1831_005637 [Alyxoria varia]